MALNLVMFGPPGAGKGTQASKLEQSRNIPQISTGAILREAVQADTELGRQAKAVMDRGELVGDAIIVGIVRERLARDDTRRGFILDGFPRPSRSRVGCSTPMATSSCSRAPDRIKCHREG